MKHRWALVVMGMWLMGSVCTAFIASQNFYAIDRLLASRPNPAFASAVDRLGSPLGRELLRYLSSELNRLYFQIWNVVQLVLGGLALWLVTARAPRRSIGAMVIMVVVTLVYLTPAIVSLGRSLDFVPRDPAPPDVRRFWILHAAYTSLEVIKLVVGVVATAGMAATPSVLADSPGAPEPSANVRQFGR